MDARDASSGITGKVPEHLTRDGLWQPNFTVPTNLQAAIGRRLTWEWSGHDGHGRPWWVTTYEGEKVTAAATEIVFVATVRPNPQPA